MLIDTSYFVGDLNIPNAGVSGHATDNLLKWFIQRHEIDLLKQWLGHDLYRDFMTALGLQSDGTLSLVTNGAADPGVPSIYSDLLNGKEYIGMDQRLHKWRGFVSLQDDFQTIKTSPIALYVYCMYMNDKTTTSSPTGEVKAKNENSDPASPALKIMRAWNRLVDWSREFIWFMDTYYTIYPNWQLQNRIKMIEVYRYTNFLSI